MSVSVTMEVATTTAITQMEVTHALAMMTTSLTVMDTLVKVQYITLHIETTILSNIPTHDLKPYLKKWLVYYVVPSSCFGQTRKNLL